MGENCPLKFEEGKMPLGIEFGTREWKRLNELTGKLTELNDYLVGMGCRGIDIDVCDMGAAKGERGPYGLFCKTHDGRGCEECILNNLGYKSERLEELYVSSIMKNDISSLVDSWVQALQ